MNYQEAPYEDLPKQGLSADYVARETRRAVAGVAGRVKIYPGIDIDVPTRPNDKRTKPEDVRQSVRAAFDAGADCGNRVSQGSNSYQDPNNRNADTSPRDFDLRHNFVTSFLYESPKFSSRAVTELLGHWQFGTLVTYHAGFPYTPTSGVDNSLTGVGQDRPNVIGDPYVRNLKTLVWAAPLAFQPNAPGKVGNAGYNSLVGPELFGMDANVSRIFHVSERHQFQLRFEFFNLLNHTNFSNPVSSFNSANFGRIQSAADPRILQFALKYSF
jgi:hypothetical protein